MAREELRQRIDLIEEAYEFLLAYAAQGLLGDAGSKTGGELRSYLDRLDDALDGLADLFRQLAQDETHEGKEELLSFLEVLEEDQRRSQAAVRLVRAQSSISSQLVDNFNGSIHIRALLTDLFLLDEILKVLGDGARAGNAGDEGDEL